MGFSVGCDRYLILAIEAAELQEIFLWKTPFEVDAVVSLKRERISAEIADIAWFLLLLSRQLDIDLVQAVEAKLGQNALKYPVDKAKGSHAKYDEL